MTEDKTQIAAPQDAPPAEPAPEPALAPAAKGQSKSGYWWGTGRRKSSVARVRIRPGDGKLLINKRQLDNYFSREQDRRCVLAPLRAVQADRLFDVFVNVQGGGTSGQSGAICLGVARALKNYNDTYVSALRDTGYLTRDSRMVERKKYGRSGARRRFQFSKR